MLKSYNTKRRTALIWCRLLLFVVVSTIVSGCTCRSNHEGDTDPELTPEQAVQVKLDAPRIFDAQQIHEYALLTERTDLTPEQLAGMTAAAEASLDKIEAQLEDLLRNEDAADSHAVLTEWAQTQWTADFATIIAYLRHTSLPPIVDNRAQTLVKASSRLNVLIHQIETDQLNGKSIGLRF